MPQLRECFDRPLIWLVPRFRSVIMDLKIHRCDGALSGLPQFIPQILPDNLAVAGYSGHWMFLKVASHQPVKRCVLHCFVLINQT